MTAKPTTTPNSYRIPFASPNNISQEAVNFATSKVYGEVENTWLPNAFICSSPTTRSENQYDVDIEHFCAPFIHPITGETITQYRKLAKDPVTHDVWQTAFGKESGRMAQGDNKTQTIGTNCIFVMSHEEIRQIPEDRVITYARIVVDFRSQKVDPN